MKEGENYEIELFERQTHFTLDDVEIKNDIKINITFIEKQANLYIAKQWLELGPKDVGVDIETRGLDPHQHEMIMLQFGDKERQFVIDTRKVNVDSIIGLLINPTTTLIGQNLKFEYKFFKHNFGLDLGDIRDTLIQEICLYNGYQLRNDLKSLADRYLNYQADKTIRMRFLEIGDDDFSKDEIIYGAYDVILPIMIDELQQKKISQRNISKLLELEHEFLKVLGDMEYKGMHLDKSKWNLLYLENQVHYQTAKEALDKYIFDNKLERFISNQGNLFDNTQKVSLSWTSPKQVIDLFKHLKICPQEVSKTTKRLTYTVDAKVLKASLNSTNAKASKGKKDFIKAYLTFKEYSQRVTTFGIKFFKYINPETGRVHSNFRQIVSTGRSSSSGPNLQNIPSDARFRECFTAPKDHSIVNADFSGQENIVLANKSLDKSLLEFYAKGNSDMHSFIASKLYPHTYKEFIAAAKDKDDDTKTLTPAQGKLLGLRQIAKAAGFALAYGGNGHTIAKNLGIPTSEGDKVYDAYFKAFPGLRKYFDDVISNTLKKGYVAINDITNRRLNLMYHKQMMSYKNKPNKRGEYNKLKSKIGRLALNAPVQGTAADITKAAGVLFRKWLNENEYTQDQIAMTNIIHDEINVEAHDNYTKIAADNLELCMGQAGNMFCKTVPLTAKAAIGTHWAH